MAVELDERELVAADMVFVWELAEGRGLAVADKVSELESVEERELDVEERELAVADKELAVADKVFGLESVEERKSVFGERELDVGELA